MFYKNKVVNRPDGSIFVVGATLTTNGHYNLLLQKRSSTNALLWTAEYDGSYHGDDFGSDVHFTSSGDVLVCGTVQTGSLNWDAVIRCYSTSGTLQWTNSYNGSLSGPDGFTTMAVDASDNIYALGGVTTSSLTDMLCVKYNSSGSQQWANSWNGYSLQDLAYRYTLNSSTISVYGGAQFTTSPTKYKLARADFNFSNGTVSSSTLGTANETEFSEIRDVVTNGSGVWVCGSVTTTSQGHDWKVVYLNSALYPFWSNVYNGSANGDDRANAMTLVGNNLFVAGVTTTSSGKDAMMRKITASNGVTGPLMTWDGGEDDEAQALFVDDNNAAYVGIDSKKAGNTDMVILRTQNMSGTVAYITRFNGEDNKEDRIINIAVDPTDGAVYLGGQVQQADGSFQSKVLKYRQAKLYLPASPTIPYSSSGGYITNQGQLRNSNGSSNTSVKYYSQQFRVNTYIDDEKISYALAASVDSTNADTIQRVDMTFTKGASTAKIEGTGDRLEYHNYALGHMSKPAYKTAIKNNVVKQGVYNQTDVYFNHTKSGFRHWVVSRSPSALVDFGMEFSGQTSLSIASNGNLKVYTPLGVIEFTRPKAYALQTTGAMTPYSWQPSFTILNSTQVEFSGIPTWSGTLLLEFGEPAVQSMLDPISNQNLAWSTYAGTSGLDTFNAVKCTSGLQSFFAGFSNSISWPNQPGIEITNVLSGGYDGLVMKFSASSEAIFVTYIGGNQNEYFFDLALNESGKIICVGSSNSANLNFTEGMWSLNYHGGTDGIFIMLDEFGTVILDTYVGGEGMDVLSAVAKTNFNGTNYLIIGGISASGNEIEPNLFPVNIARPNSGQQDGFFCVLNASTFDIISSSYFGGIGNDDICDIETNGNSFYITGLTSTDYYSDQECDIPTDGGFPICITQNWQHEWFVSTTSNIENRNSYIAEIGLIGSCKWSTYCARAVDVEGKNTSIALGDYVNGNNHEKIIYLCSTAPPSSEGDMPPIMIRSGINAYNQESLGQSREGLIQMFKRDDSGVTVLAWCTFFGGQEGDNILGVAANLEDISFCIIGSTQSSNVQNSTENCSVPNGTEFPICNHTSDYYIEDTNNGIRSFIARFSSTGELVWSTLFGMAENNKILDLSQINQTLFVSGYSTGSWTPWEYDTGSNADYFQSTLINQAKDATLARFELGSIVGIESELQLEKNTISIYPNPASTLVQFNSQNPIDELVIYDCAGRICVCEKFIISKRQFNLDITQLAQGSYVAVAKYNSELQYFSIPFHKL